MQSAVSLIAGAKKASLASLVGAVAAIATLAATPSAGASITPHRARVEMSLSHSISPKPVFLARGVCGISGVDNSVSCDETIVKAIDAARKVEPVNGMPSTFNATAFSKLTYAEQIFAITDIERTARRLAPIAGLTVQLNVLAGQGASGQRDPAAPLPLYLSGGGISTEYGSNWSSGAANALGADYFWMYDDGTDSPNTACQRNGEAACWGHRHNILGAYNSASLCPAGMRTNMVMGAAEATTRVGNAPSIAELFVNDCGNLPTMYFTWPDVQKLVFGH